MNYRGSYRKLLENSKAAMMAAIEIYNKPAFKYRDECVVILRDLCTTRFQSLRGAQRRSNLVVYRMVMRLLRRPPASSQ